MSVASIDSERMEGAWGSFHDDPGRRLDLYTDRLSKTPRPRETSDGPLPLPHGGKPGGKRKDLNGPNWGSAGARLGIQHAGGFFNSPSVAGVASTPTQASDERNLGISVDAMLGPMSQARHVRCGSQVGRGSLTLMSAGGDSALVR